jgi:hypothetical protein
MEWFHVSPLFLLPRILAADGLRCGADLDVAASPRRQSSRGDDDVCAVDLGDRRPAEFVMLFRLRNPPLLDEKLRGHRRKDRPWNAYPHLRLEFCARRCMENAGGRVFASLDNVGRTLGNGEQPRILSCTSPGDISTDVEEILLPATSLPDRRLPLNALQRIIAFSPGDHALVQAHLSWANAVHQVDLCEKQKYAQSQIDGPGRTLLELTSTLFRAIREGDHDSQTEIMEQLATTCFD